MSNKSQSPSSAVSIMEKRCIDLFTAICDGDVECIKRLLRSGADQCARNYKGETSLDVAVKLGKCSAVLALLEPKPAHSFTPNPKTELAQSVS